MALDFDRYSLRLNIYPVVMDEGAYIGINDDGYRNRAGRCGE
jgi:hypothetical protein